ncbi:hyaluronan synthase [Pedobacter glucosidilyticus]|nr:glycosyltransferase [Pedobacter glucosidilyticus]KHJ36983.1 hyaluronan synthase [Pedobacter glucosidilyticus]
MTKVSIIIPNYNHYSFLEQRINSIFSQTFKNFELIILDDCSTDNSIDLLNKFKKHPKVKHIILNNSNSGSPFKQWTKGISLAEGEYIWIAESDDFAEPEFLDRCLELLLKNPNAGLVYTDSNIIDNNLKIGEFKLRRQNNPIKWNTPYIKEGIIELEESLINNCTINNVSAVLFKKEAISNCLNDIIKFRYAGDWLSYMIICLKYDILYTPECLNNCRLHEDNLTKKSNHLYLGLRERIKARQLIYHKLTAKHKTLRKKIDKLNKAELRALTSGFINLKIGAKDYFKTLYAYLIKSNG